MTFKSATFVQVSKDVFDSAKTYDDVKDNNKVFTTRLILEDKKNSISFVSEIDDMKGFIKKEKNNFFLNFGQTKKLYPTTIKKDDLKVFEGKYITYRNI